MDLESNNNNESKEMIGQDESNWCETMAALFGDGLDVQVSEKLQIHE